MKKFLFNLFLLFSFLIPQIAISDSIFFSKDGEGIEAQILEIKDESITVKIKKSQLSSLKLEFANLSPYPDSISFKQTNSEFKGKVIETTDDFITIKFPKSSVQAIKIDFSQDTKTVPLKAEEISQKDKEETESHNVKEKMKPQEIPLEKQWVAEKMEDMEKRLATIEQKSQKKEVSEKEEKEKQVGNIEGRVLWNNEPFSGCKIRIVRMIEKDNIFSSFFQYTKDLEENLAFESAADSSGIYRFSEIPKGSYKIKFMPPKSKYWIRSLSPTPDVIVTPGKTNHPKDIQANVRTIN